MTTDEHARMMRANEANWDARTPVHLASRFYGLSGSPDPSRWFASWEWEDLGAVADRDVLHLQCHLGTETLAFAERGARAVGLDFSEASVTAARGIAAKEGALCYLPDLTRWAETVSRLLRPGGLLYIVEFHPLLNSLGPKPAPDDTGELLLRHDYLGARGAVHRDATFTYTDGPAVAGATESFEWMHGMDEVVNALIGAGLTIRRLRESDELPWPRWPRMEPTESGWWRLPEPRIPLLYGLLASR
jgi:hypothetical protein